MFSWIGISAPMPATIKDHFVQFRCLGRKKKGKRLWMVIWHSVVWNLWIVRNNCIFNLGQMDPLGILEQIKIQSWTWILPSLEMTSLCFSNWLLAPLSCLDSLYL